MNDKLRSLVLAETLDGNLISNEKGLYTISLKSEEFDELSWDGKYVVCNDILLIKINKSYVPYFWKVFAGYNFKVNKSDRVMSSFLFEGNCDTIYNIMFNLRPNLEKVREMQSKYTRY